MFVHRRLKYVHLGLHIPLLSTRVFSELIAIIKDFEKENRDPKYLFIFRKLRHTTKFKYDYIITEKKVCNKASVKFTNKTKKQVKEKIAFSRCYGHGVLFVAIDLEGFEVY